MRVAVFNTKRYDRTFFEAANAAANAVANADRRHDLVFLEPRLTRETVALAAGFPAVCVFVNDTLDGEVLRALADQGTRLIALRCAGFNNVDLVAAAALGLAIVRVPAYSPYAVAEHAVGLILALNRQIPRAVARVRDGDFSLDGLLGFDLHGRTVGVVGTGQIGAVVVRILRGFGCDVLAHDPVPNPVCVALGARYVDLPALLAAADIVTLHCPLLPQTHHLIDAETLGRMRPGVMLINTSRGALLDTRAVIAALKSGTLGYLGLDVYEEEAALFFEEEAALFFEDRSDRVLQDDVFARLLTFPNVLITGHQAFFTREALTAIAEITLANIAAIEQDLPCANAVTVAPTPA